MAAQVEVQTAEVGRTSVGGRLHLSPLTDSSNSLMEISQAHIITPEPNKPVPGPKPRLTPKPFAVERNTTIKPIVAPKPQPKPRPESTRPAGYKPDLPNSPKPQHPPAKPRPLSANPNRPASTSFKTANKLSTGQTTKPVVHPFKPAPSLDPGDPTKPGPPAPAERPKPAAPSSLAYSKSLKKLPAAEWSGSTKREDEKEQGTSSKGGASITRAKSMGFLLEVGQEEEKAKQEVAVPLRPQPRGSRPRPVSAIFLDSPTKTESPVPAPRWVGRRPLSADLTSKFESIGLSLHRKAPSLNTKENTPERNEPEMIPQSTEADAKPAVSDLSNKKTEEQPMKETDEEGRKRAGSIKSRISLLLDSSSSPAAAPSGSELHSLVQPDPEAEAAVGVKRLIKQLTEDTPPTQSTVVKPPLKPRPLPLDLTKRFSSERSPDFGSEATDRHDISKDPPRRIEESAFTPSDQKTFVDLKDSQEPLRKASTPEGAEAGHPFGATTKESVLAGDVQTVRASLFENVVERHSVLMMDDSKPANKVKESLRSPSFKRGTADDEGTLVTATYKEPVSPSSPLRVLHAFDTVTAVEENRAASENIPSAQREDKAMTLRTRRSEGGRPTPERTAEPEQRPRYLRVGALQKWNATGPEQEASTEKGMQKEPRREEQAAPAEQEEVAAASPKRLKTLQAEEQLKPRATYFALTGQMQEPFPAVDAAASTGALSGRKSASLAEALGKTSQNQVEELLKRSYGEIGQGSEETMDGEKKRELKKEAERQKAKMKELEREKQRALESEKEAHLEFERMKERERQREYERQRQKAFEKEKKELEEKQRALERQKQIELEQQKLQELERERQEKERQRQLEREKRRELERQRRIEREKQREQERERQREQERQRQREEERQRELDKERQLLEIQKEKQKMEELERLKEQERLQLLEFQKQKQKEKERQHIIELEKQRLREKKEREEAEKIRQMALEQEMLRLKELDKERERQREMEKERQREMEKERQREMEKERQRELERQRQRNLEKERQELENQRLRQREQEKERQRKEEMERMKEMERRQILELEKQRQAERERQKQLDMERQELENQRLRQQEQEKERQRKEEMERMKEMERMREMERMKEMERMREMERIKEMERMREMERRQLLELEKQRQAERERQELERRRLRETMECEEAEKMRQIAKQQEAERQRLKEKQKKEEQERAWMEASPLRPKVVDLDSVLRDDPFQKTPPQRSDPATRWKEPSPRAEESYKSLILDIDSFTSQAPLSPTTDLFPASAAQSGDAASGGRLQPEVSWKLPPQTTGGFSSPVWTSSPQDPWELRPVEMSVDKPAAEPSSKQASRVGPEQLLLRQEERLLVPQRPRSAAPDDSLLLAPVPGTEAQTGGSPGGDPESGTAAAEQIWIPRQPQRQDSVVDSRSHRRSHGSQELNRMRSRSVSRRSAPSGSAVEGSLSRMRSRSAHRDLERPSWVQQKQSNSGEEEGKESGTPVRETDSQYGTWETGLRTDDSLTPASPSSESNLSPSPKKPTPPLTPGDLTSQFDSDTVDSLQPSSSSESQTLSFPDAPVALLDTSALRSRAQLGKKRAPRTRPTRAARQTAEGGASSEDWLYRDSTETKVESKDEESDSEEATRGADGGPAAVASQPQRIAMFPGMDPSALKAQLKKRGDSDNQSDGPAPSPSQLSRSPKSPFLPRAARVLPPAGGKENGEGDSPQWLKELKTKKRLSQYENES